MLRGGWQGAAGGAVQDAAATLLDSAFGCDDNECL